jgi:hypothetical protein
MLRFIHLGILTMLDDDLPGRAGQVHSWRIVQAVVGSTVVQFLVVFLAAVALLVMHPLLIR